MQANERVHSPRSNLILPARFPRVPRGVSHDTPSQLQPWLSDLPSPGIISRPDTSISWTGGGQIQRQATWHLAPNMPPVGCYIRGKGSSTIRRLIHDQQGEHLEVQPNPCRPSENSVFSGWQQPNERESLSKRDSTAEVLFCGLGAEEPRKPGLEKRRIVPEQRAGFSPITAATASCQ